MNRNHFKAIFAAVLLGSLALTGCKMKDEEPVPAPAAVEPAPAPEPMAPEPAAVTATTRVDSVDLGTATGADMRITAPMTAFGKNDTIIAAVAHSTSDPAANVAGTLSAKWTTADGTVINEETKDVNFTGVGVTNFQVAKPEGWAPGTYKLEISLDGTVVQTREFTVS